MPSHDELDKYTVRRLARDIIRNLPMPDAAFPITNGTVEFPVAKKPPTNGEPKYWRALKIEFLAFSYAVGDEGKEDEPEFVIASTKDGHNSLYRVPAGKADPPMVPAFSRRVPAIPVLTLNALDDGKPHSIAISALAFDSDADSGWKKVVEALGKDVEDVGYRFLDGIAAGTATPGNMLKFLTGKLTEFLTDDPELIGGEETVVNHRHVWLKPDKVGDKEVGETWTAWKWIAFARAEQAAWYLSLWRITLDSRPVEFSCLQRKDDDLVDLEDALALVHVPPSYAGVLRVLQGEPIEVVASALDVDPAEIRRQTDALVAGNRSDLETGIRDALISEVKALRNDLAALRLELDQLKNE